MSIIIALILALLLVAPVQAATYFEETFEDGTFDVGSGYPQPTWYWPSNNDTVGANAWWKITSVDKHGGSWAIRLDYLARNGRGNTCGGTTAYQKAGHSGTYFVSSTGANLTLTPYVGSGSIVGRYLYDGTKNHTLWQITEAANQDATNDRLNLTLVTPGPGYDANVTISPGDTCFICRACGVDSNVAGGAGQESRRNDCDTHSLFLQGFSAFPYGSTIYRRFYFKLSSDYVKPSTGQKIGYSFTIGALPVGATFFQERGGVYLKELAYAHDTLGYHAYSGSPLPLVVNQWHYIEEMFKSESSSGAADGEYKLWFARDGEDPGAPVKTLTGKSLKPITGGSGGGMSIWGNSQFYEDRAGYAYVDDIVVSDTRVGPTGYVAPSCGDSSCNGSETCATCAADCGACPETCGDLACNGAETCQTCPGDCGACPPSCGDGTCNGDETCSTCPQDCGSCAGAGVGVGRRVHGGCIIGGGMKVQ
jgi:hypothetical protein